MGAVARVLSQTPKAYRITDGENVCWMPKSLVRTEGWDFDLVEVPLNVAQEKGLFVPWDWEPVESTKEATLYVLRKYGYGSQRMTRWLLRHEKKLTVWLERYRKLNKAK